MTCRGRIGWLVCEGRLGGHGCQNSVWACLCSVCVCVGEELLKCRGGIEGPQTDVGVLGVGGG